MSPFMTSLLDRIDHLARAYNVGWKLEYIPDNGQVAKSQVGYYFNFDGSVVNPGDSFPTVEEAVMDAIPNILHIIKYLHDCEVEEIADKAGEAKGNASEGVPTAVQTDKLVLSSTS